MKTRINYRPEISEVFKAVTDKKLDRRYYLILDTNNNNTITYSLCKNSMKISDEDINNMVEQKLGYSDYGTTLDQDEVASLLKDLRDEYEEFIKEVFDE